MLEPKHFPRLSQLGSLTATQTAQHVKLYEGYVRACNTIDARLALVGDEPCNGSFSERSELLRRRPFAFNGMLLHELYFEALGADEGPDAALGERITRYGGLERVRTELAAVAGCGVGWAILSRDTQRDWLAVSFVAEHHIGHLLRHEVLLALDSWEHAFQTDYGIDRDRYARAVLQEINWGVVSKRLMLSHGGAGASIERTTR